MGTRGLDILRQELAILEQEMLADEITPQRALELRGQLERLREKLKEEESLLFRQNW